MKRTGILLLTLFITSVLVFSCSKSETKKQQYSGLIGVYCSEPDLTSIKAMSVLQTLDQKWDEQVDYEGDTSGRWNGYLVGASTGNVVFKLSTNRQVELILDKTDTLKVTANQIPESIEFSMKKGKAYPIQLTFINPGKKTEAGAFIVEWNIDGNSFEPIDKSSLHHTEKEAAKLNFLKKAIEAKIDSGSYQFAKAKHTIVYYAKGRFAAWPANGGIWSWGNEIALLFTQAYFKDNAFHHAIDRLNPINNAMARSLDGGKTWKMEDASIFDGGDKEIQTNKVEINFSSPGFAMRNTEEVFYYSYDKARNWQGPFSYPNFGGGKLSARTDYLITSNKSALVFSSVMTKSVRGPLQDKAIVIKTVNGGKSFEFLSHMTENDNIRSVMPATVRIDENHLISALRRRQDPPKDSLYALPKNWIDVYESKDNGMSWEFLHKIDNTDTGIRNGNPPSMVKLKNGWLCVVYGFRGSPSGIRARISKDKGKSWSKIVILRNDASTWDIGYCRSVVREDGKVVSAYYYATKERPERHIAATIWDPKKLINP